MPCTGITPLVLQASLGPTDSESRWNCLLPTA